MGRPPKVLVPMLFAVLAIATAGAFAESQRLKTQPLVLDMVRLGVGERGSVFTPNGDCKRDETRIRFRLTRPDRVTIQIVRPGGQYVRTLIEDRELRAYKYFRFWWDGTDDQGLPVATGPYRVRVRLVRQERELLIGGRLRLHQSSYRPGPNCNKERRDPPVQSKADSDWAEASE